jgi:hypothetical protein
LLSIYDIAEDEAIPTYRAADRLARERIRRAREQKVERPQPVAERA